MPKPVLTTPTLTASGAVVGRPRKPVPKYKAPVIREEPPEDVFQIIERCAAEGRTLVGIAKELGTTDFVLRRWMSEDPMLKWAHRRGKDADEEKWVAILKRDALDQERPNINAIVYLKCRHGWREGDPGEQPNRVNIVFNLPGAMTKEQFAATVVAHE
jgi:hypothetical protein